MREKNVFIYFSGISFIASVLFICLYTILRAYLSPFSLLAMIALVLLAVSCFVPKGRVETILYTLGVVGYTMCSVSFVNLNTKSTLLLLLGIALIALRFARYLPVSIGTCILFALYLFTQLQAVFSGFTFYRIYFDLLVQAIFSWVALFFQLIGFAFLLADAASQTIHLHKLKNDSLYASNQRLIQLKKQLENHEITEEDYQKQKNEILQSL